MSLGRQVPEIQNLLSWLGTPARSPLQVHGIHEADSEILKLESGPQLVVNIDSISEEIAVGLYRDPFTMGWMTAQAALSDLATSGAEPLGLLFSAQWGAGISDDFKSEVSRGLQSALADAGTFLLGGDTGESHSTVLTGAGIGVRPSQSQCITRMGILPGDYLCITGQSGLGPALAFQLLRGEDTTLEVEFRSKVKARLDVGRALSHTLRASIDTSDGIVSSLNTLRLVNQVGLELWWNPETLDPVAVQFCRARSIPLWMLWVGEHGDFQLISAIPPERLSEAQRLCPGLRVIGRATAWRSTTTLKVASETQGETQEIEFDLSDFISLGKNLSPHDLAARLVKWTQTLGGKGFP